MSRALAQAVTWLEDGVCVALVAVTAVEGSTPRMVGPAMAVHPDGSAAGSVSVGCVDGETHALALEALTTGRPVRRRYHGPSESTDPEAGDHDLPPDLLDLAPTILCGGAMTVEVTPLTAADLPRLRAARQAAADARPLLLLYGAGEVAADLTRLGTAAGRRVVVVDHRAVFATPQRFPEADEVRVARPHRHLQELVAAGRIGGDTAVVVLAHDAQIEDPVIEVALASDAGYVGLLGSRTTHERRLERLAPRIDVEALARLHGPAGLDLGGVTSAETALSILAEIVAVSRGGSGSPLVASTGAIHPGRGEHRGARGVTRPGVPPTDIGPHPGPGAAARP